MKWAFIIYTLFLYIFLSRKALFLYVRRLLVYFKPTHDSLNINDYYKKIGHNPRIAGLIQNMK